LFKIKACEKNNHSREIGFVPGKYALHFIGKAFHGAGKKIIYGWTLVVHKPGPCGQMKGIL
jgi:hypothetical protein